jgi:hypothetical protein
MTITKAPRSNKPLTSFACSILRKFLDGNFRATDRYEETRGNTTVRVDNLMFRAYLYGQRIFTVCLSNGEVAGICVAFTDTFDSAGMPTRTVRERLNGLLDTLGQKRVLPYNVRVFIDPSYGIAYLGRNDDKVAIGRDLGQIVYIAPDANVLEITEVKFTQQEVA